MDRAAWYTAWHRHSQLNAETGTGPEEPPKLFSQHHLLDLLQEEQTQPPLTRGRQRWSSVHKAISPAGT